MSTVIKRGNKIPIDRLDWQQCCRVGTRINEITIYRPVWQPYYRVGTKIMIDLIIRNDTESGRK